MKVLKKIGKFILLIFECIFYLIGVLFAIDIFLDLTSKK